MINKILVKEVDIVDTEPIRNSLLILKSATKSVNDFYALFQAKSTANSRKQDLLRAMLVFACSGLDAIIKQLIKDTLALIIDADQNARKELQKYVDRSLLQKSSGGNEQSMRLIDTMKLAQILTSNNPREDMIDMHVASLCSDSLQSRDQILRIAASFAITKEAIMSDSDTIETAFSARNQIIHEMDVELSDGKNRCERSEGVIKKYCEEILLIGKKFIAVVSGKLDKAEKDSFKRIGE